MNTFRSAFHRRTLEIRLKIDFVVLSREGKGDVGNVDCEEGTTADVWGRDAIGDRVLR